MRHSSTAIKFKEESSKAMKQYLLDSISGDSPSELETLVPRGLASLELRSKDIGELFVYAAFLGSRSCFEVLSHFVADVNIPRSLEPILPGYPLSPLRAAVQNDHTDIVTWLCDHGADVNQREAVWSTQDVFSSVWLKNSCSMPCLVPIHFVRSAKCAQILLEHGADMNALDCTGKVPLAVATLEGRLDVLELFCQRGARINAASTWGATALMYAQYARLQSDRVAATEVLCRFGAHVNLLDRNGRTVLHIAKDVECVRLLLSYGADTGAETVFGKTPIMAAVENQKWDIFELLRATDARPRLGSAARGNAFSVCLAPDVLTSVKMMMFSVMDLRDLCRCVIRTQLRPRWRNIDQAIDQLPLPSSTKNFLSFRYHPQSNTPTNLS